MSEVITAKRGRDIIISINGVPMAGQKGITLNRGAAAINVTNKISSDWQENLAGTKNWSVSCSGVFMVSDAAMAALEKAFIDGTAIQVKILEGNGGYVGNAIITYFPIDIPYESTLTYALRLLGDGPLNPIQPTIGG